MKRTGTPTGWHAGFVAASLAPVLSSSFPLVSASPWYQTSMSGVLDAPHTPRIHPYPEVLLFWLFIAFYIRLSPKAANDFASSAHIALGNCFDFLHPWGQITVATAISVALQPPFLVHYKEMLPLLSSSCWINLVNSSWPEVVRSYLSAWCFWVGYMQWHFQLQTLRLLNDSLSIRCRAVS